MANYAIITDLNRCTGCLACTVACKAINGVDVGNFWIKTLRVGPHPIEGGSGTFPDVEMYFLPVQCQHCENPECVKVCPTEASHVAEDGSIHIDKEKCIGCQFCAMSCPYGVRYLNEEERVVEKCTLCQQRTAHTFAPAFGHNHQIAEIGESSCNKIVFLLLCLLFPNAGKATDLSQILCQKDLLIFLYNCLPHGRLSLLRHSKIIRLQGRHI